MRLPELVLQLLPVHLGLLALGNVLGGADRAGRPAVGVALEHAAP